MKELWILFIKWAVELYEVHNVIVRCNNKSQNNGGSGGYRSKVLKIPPYLVSEPAPR
jgi:hypothetical protein